MFNLDPVQASATRHTPFSTNQPKSALLSKENIIPASAKILLINCNPTNCLSNVPTLTRVQYKDIFICNES